MTAELTRMTAAQLAAARSRRGEVSAVEVTQAHLDRIAAGRRRRCTRSCTSRPSRARGGPGGGRPRAPRASRSARWPGVPLALKDVFTTADMPTTCGSQILDGWQPPYDATVTRRLREAGRRDPRQDEHGRVRDGLLHGELRVRPLAQPVGPDPGPGRLVRRLVRRGDRVRGAAGHRHRHRRLDPPARRRSAGSSGSSRPTAARPGTAWSPSPPRWTRRARWPGPCSTRRCCTRRCPGTTRATPPRSTRRCRRWWPRPGRPT